MTEILRGRKKYLEPGQRVKCAFCRGSGIQPRSLQNRCIPCRGKGEMEFDGPAIKCFSCKGKGRVSYSSALSCVRCRGIGAVEKDKGGDAADIMRKRLGEITKRLRWTRKETKKKTKEIEKRLKPIKSFVKEVSARGGSAFGGKKESQWLEKLVNKIKKG